MNNSFSHCSSLIDFYLNRYREGQADDAFHGLLELENVYLPDLARAFRSSTDTSVRVLLLNVIWQHREPAQIPLLAEALFDEEQDVWQEAMDGLVTLACTESFEALKRARSRSFDSDGDKQKFHKWLDEAIGQIEAELDLSCGELHPDI